VSFLSFGAIKTEMSTGWCTIPGLPAYLAYRLYRDLIPQYFPREEEEKGEEEEEEEEQTTSET